MAETFIESRSGMKHPQNRLLVGTATLGTVRMEWCMARFGQVIPCNWSMGNFIQQVTNAVPFGYLVADAQNIIVSECIRGNFEWLLLVEDDTMLPADAFLRFNEYIRKADTPVVSGLYYTKSMPTEPLAYRGRGNSYFDDFKLGDKVWVDGVPTGCLLIHGSILRLMWDESPEYRINHTDTLVHRVFEQPEFAAFNHETQTFEVKSGTSDLRWCDRVMEQDVLRRAGWPKIAKKKYPYLLDTSIFCRHITPDGQMYPPDGMLR